jgi:hypothetical protein
MQGEQKRGWKKERNSNPDEQPVAIGAALGRRLPYGRRVWPIRAIDGCHWAWQFLVRLGSDSSGKDAPPVAKDQIVRVAPPSRQ